jgi:hypothetical protein
MAARHVLVLGVVVSAVAAPAAAHAKEQLVSVRVCGADRCVSLSDHALGEASAILQRPFFRRSAAAVPFYDVLFVWRKTDGRVAAYDPLRWAPKAGATRTFGARGAVWSRTSVALTAALSAATVGLRPRPAGELDAPGTAAGTATAAVRHELSTPAMPPPAAASEPGGWGTLGWTAAVASLAAVLVAWTAIARRARAA